MKSKMKTPLIPTSLSLAIAMATPLITQASEAELLQLEEVVVTARKITESVQDIPVAVNVFDSQTAKDLNINDVQGMVEFTPGATFASSFPGEQRLSIRGVSSGDGSASGGAGVLMMIDEEVIARDFMYSAAAFDISRVEVLRGPQGTTYGRNAAGGVVHVISSLPTAENEFYTKVNVGNYDLIETEAVINGPLTENLLGRVAFYSQQQEGYNEDATTGKSVDDSDSQAVRGTLLFEASDDVEIILRGNWSKDNKDNPAPRKLRDNQADDAFAPLILTEVSDDPWEVSNSDNLFYDREIWGLSATVNWSTEHFDLTSITTYRSGEDEARVDLFGSPLDIVVQNSFNDAYTYSQEVRLNGLLEDAGIQWLAGLYYLHENHEREETREIFTNDPAFTALEMEVVQRFNQQNQGDSYGLFGELSYDITDQTAISAGLRYSYDKKDYDVVHEIVSFIPGLNVSTLLASNFMDDPTTPVVGDTDESWSSVTGKISLTHQFNEDSNIYFTVGNGTKSGGFNPEPANLEALTTPYDEEKVLSMELGFKSELLDRRLRLNAAIFDSSYEDIQTVGFLSSGTSIVENAGEATIRGFEADFMWLLTENFTLVGSYANYDAEYDKRMDDELGDLSGEKLEEVPDWSGHIGAIYEHHLANDDRLRLRVDYRSRSDVIGLRDADVGDLDRPGKDIFNASLGWLSADETWEVIAWGENLGNQAEILVSGPSGVGNVSRVTYGAPLTFGVSVAYHLK
ncbi:TonB-dependent receptor [Maricurvus nonylphenolicus]|uniref:TonB-dependent receptor n=1 Tax=Maricurvus nonylphenolicus TaxID=1008307 RepID=UPI0036F2D387